VAQHRRGRQRRHPGRDHHRHRPAPAAGDLRRLGLDSPRPARNSHHLTWELEPDGDHTLLRFTNQVDAPAQDVRTAAGWHLHLDAMATVLAGGEVDIAHPDDLFAPLQQAYTEKYGAPPEPG
jgi:hypothetical protein